MTRQSKLPDVDKKISENKNKRRRKKILSVMAVLVALTTAGILMKPAIALQEDTYCGLEEHTHSDECYELVMATTEMEDKDELGTDDIEENGETKSENNDEDSQDIQIEQVVRECHVHTDECYTYVDDEDSEYYSDSNRNSNSNDSDDEGHTHDDDCYEKVEKLICDKEEEDSHTHDDDCYEIKRELTCDNEDEDHEHDDDCYEEEKELTCDKEETKGHTHSEEDGCYSYEYYLTCDKEEGSVGSDNNNGSDDNKSDEGKSRERVLICGKTEDDYEEYVEETKVTENNKNEQKVEAVTEIEIENETETETETETSTEEIKDKVERILICEKEVHTHTLQCYSNPDADVETDKDWEATLPNADEYTGDVRLDIIAVAQSQLGYTESTKNYLVVNDDEKKGYTRYGQWYGDIYGDWNAMFASFCVYYSGADDLPIDEFCDSWIEALSDPELDLYRSIDDEYTPQEGDLVFFDTDEDDTADWVGIIEKINDDGDGNITSIETIEGDLEDRVDRASYEIGDATIIGYGLLDSEVDDDDSLKKSKETFKFTATTESGITVTVSGKSEVLPYPADEITMTAKDVENEEVDELVGLELEKEGLSSAKNYQVDISLWHVKQDKDDADSEEEADNEEETENEDETDSEEDVEEEETDSEDNQDQELLEEIQPTGPVKVTFSGIDLEEDHQLKIYHIEDDEEDNANAKDMEIEMNDDGEAVVDTEHFSTFVIAGVAFEVPNGHLLSGDISTLTSMEGNYQLVGDAWTDSLIKIKINKNAILDLNGYVLYFTDPGELFKVYGNFIITDSSKDRANDESNRRVLTVFPKTLGAEKQLYGNKAGIEFDTINYKENETIISHNIVTSLTYYVTDSEVSGIGTNDSVIEYVIEPSGMIVGENAKCTSLVNVDSDGTFELCGGLLAVYNNNGKSGSIVRNEGTFKYTDGYICGGSNSSTNGGGVYSSGTMTMEGGVIAANTGTKGGGVYIAEGSTFIMSGGVISGNTASVRANQSGGGGIYVDGGTLNISGGYVTNNSYNGEYLNKVKEYENGTLKEDGDKGSGCHGGGGIASCNGTVTMTNGYVTGNYSKEAGGGMYVGYSGNGTDFTMSGGTIASNYCEYSEGGGIRISGGTNGSIKTKADIISEDEESTEENSASYDNTKVYITNNITNTENDWGGGGIFIQENGTLTVYSSLITNNTASGFGGGVAACPSGTIAVVKTKGTAMYDNTAKGTSFSGGTLSKGDDQDTIGQTSYNGEHKDLNFKDSECYKDLYCVKTSGNDAIVIALGEMLGGEPANWKGRCDGVSVEISKTMYQTANWLCGLTSNPTEDAKSNAIASANVVISGNTSSIHGGGIMSNGKLVLGQIQEFEISCPPIEITGTKALEVLSPLSELPAGVNPSQFKFLLFSDQVDEEKGQYGEKPVWEDGKWNYSRSTFVTETEADDDGNFKLVTSNGNVGYDSAGTYTYYLIEETGSDVNIIYDPKLYIITVDIVEFNVKVLDVNYTAYLIESVDSVCQSNDNVQTVVENTNIESNQATIQLMALSDEYEEQDISEQKEETTENTSTSYRIYYDNSDTNWQNVWIYVWDDNGNIYTSSWHGNEMIDNGDGTFYYDLPGTGEKYVIFNNGKNDPDREQTDNLVISEYIKNYHRESEPYTIYYDNSITKYENVYAYVWNDKNEKAFGDWPGIKMTRDGESDIYYIEMPDEGEKYVIFNNGNGGAKNQQNSVNIIEIIDEKYVGIPFKGYESYTLNLKNYFDNADTFTNKVMAPVNLQLTKKDARYDTDSSFADTVLSDAVFNLYEVNGTVDVSDNLETEDGTIYYQSDGNIYSAKLVCTGTSGTDGIVKFEIGSCEYKLKRDTTYYLKEVKAPKAYDIGGPWLIKVSNESNPSAMIYTVDSSLDESGMEVFNNISEEIGIKKDIKKDNATNTNIIKLSTIITDNATAYELPHTGGHGTLPYVIGGALLVTCSGLLLWHRANKRRKEDIAST